MKYQRFEDLPVWQASIELGRHVYALTESPAFKSRYSLRDQIERAAVSVSNNIAEGFERGTNQELLTFLYIARGSAGEVRSMLYLLNGMEPFRNLESEMRNLRERTDGISKQLGAWARTLQDSDLKGRRYVTEKTRQAAEKARGREEFLKHLEEIREGGQSKSAIKNSEPGSKNAESGSNNPKLRSNDPKSGGNDPTSGSNFPQSGGNNPKSGSS